jgi:hypothetical protein
VRVDVLAEEVLQRTLYRLVIRELRNFFVEFRDRTVELIGQ